MTAPRCVRVLLPLALPHPYTYGVPDDMDIELGNLVSVPLGSKHIIGCVWDRQAEELPATKLKMITSQVSGVTFPDDLRRFIDFVSYWTLSPHGLVLRLLLRTPSLLTPQPVRRAIQLGNATPTDYRLTPARQKILTLLEQAQDNRLERSQLLQQSGVSASVLDGLLTSGAVHALDLPPNLGGAPLTPNHHPPQLNPAQSIAAQTLRQRVQEKRFSTTLLQGVTGSGKTEVYCEAIAQALEQGQQVLVLLPEIALTTQFLERFTARFGARPTEWHSSLSAAKRPQIWQGVASGQVQVVVGARSGLFLPFCNLGLIVVDEEHDSSFKQEEGVRYHARDMAVMRGHLSGFAVVLASATPSLESWSNAQTGRYHLLELPTRFGRHEVPHLRAIDLKKDPPPKGRWLSPALQNAIEHTLARGEQALLFLNRRGYAPLTLCQACGHRFRCPSCAAWLTEHRQKARLQCHHCGHEEAMPQACPACGTSGKLMGIGPGVERIHEEAEQLFPTARTLILSSDMDRGMTQLRAQISAVERGDVDIIIGTQLVAKGHNFKNLTLVGIVDGDIGLGTGDPRAAERCFQMLHQVVGRAGRGDIAGQAFVQTHAPNHPVMAAILAGDARHFYSRESDERNLAVLPPFGRLTSLIISGEDAARTKALARALVKAAPHHPDISVLGPVEAPLALLRGRFRFRLLVKTARHIDMQKFLRQWMECAPKATQSMRIEIDVDPQNFA